MYVDVTKKDVELQLQRIVNSDVFSASPKLRKFLQYIVEETLQGNGSRLKQYSIATNAFGLNENFDPDTNPAVRLDAGRLRIALESYYKAEGVEDTIRISVPKGRYIPIFERVASKPQLASSKNVESLGRTGIFEPNRLLIMKLKESSIDGGVPNFSEGMTEQLIVEFSRYPDITVSTSSDEAEEQQLQSSDTELDLRTRFVLCGSVTSSISAIRVTFQLHDRMSGTVIWADRFDVKVGSTDVLGAQEEIAGHIAGIIGDDFGILSYRMSLELESRIHERWSAQNTNLFHRHMARTLTEHAYQVARKNIEIGVKELPNNPMIWAARAQAVFYGNVLGYDQDEDWLNLVYYCAQRSLELDRNSHYAQVAIAQFHLYNRDFKAVIDICDRLLEKNPRSASNQLSTGFFRALAGDWDEGCQLLSKAIKRLHNPPGWAYKALFLNSYRLGRYEEALSFINQYFVPEHFTPPLLRAVVLFRLGRLDEAEKAADDVRRINPSLREHVDTYFRYLSTSDDLTDNLQDALRHLDLI